MKISIPLLHKIIRKIKSVYVEKLILNGHKLLAQGKSRQAIICFRKALKVTDLKVGIANFHVIPTLVSAGLVNEADHIYSSLYKLCPNSFDALFSKALSADKIEDWETSLRFLEVIFKRYPNKKNCEKCQGVYANACSNLVREAIEKQEWRNAADFFESWSNNCLESLDIYMRQVWAAVLLELGHKEDVLAQLSTVYPNEHWPHHVNIPNHQKETNITPLSKKLNYEHIFVVTYARSGSTLLQGLLNSIDGVLIRGENNNAFQSLYDMYQRLFATDEKTKFNISFSDRDSFKPYKPQTDPWHGFDQINKHEVLDQFRSLARTILLSDIGNAKSIQCFGFKEVRYLDLYESGIKLKEYLFFLDIIFPNSAIIFNTRNLNNVLKSAWWSNLSKKERSSKLNVHLCLEAEFSNYASENKNCYEITYEDVISKNDNLKGLYAFLGSEYIPSKVDAVLSRKHSY